jgi:putative pyruvate formate lyase activating enzyme
MNSKRAEELEARLDSAIFAHTSAESIVSRPEGFCHWDGGLSSRHTVLITEKSRLYPARGSGTIFFGNCNMRCVYCQNYQISQDYSAQQANETDCHTLAKRMLYLQDELGCHNINLVTPIHFVPQIVKALVEAIPMGLHLPLVYNSGGYDSLETIQTLEGIIDIYLPDLRYASNENGKKYSQSLTMQKENRAKLSKMYRQVGDLKVDENEVAYQGVIVRHLILPNGLAGSEDSLTWLAHEVSPTVTVSLMSQYHPVIGLCNFRASANDYLR